MKTEFVICLIAAAGLHAGLVFIGTPSSSPARVDTSMEVGLESGTENAPVENPVPAAPEDAPPSVPDEILPQPEQKTEPPPEPREAAETPPEPQRDEPGDKPEPQPSPPAIAAQPQSSPAAPTSAKTNKDQPLRAPARTGGGGTMGTISTVRYRERAALSYPGSALRQRIGGLVLLVVDIDDTGHATGVTIRQSSGNADLDRAAIACARQSTYEPYRINGIAQPCRVEAPFKFDASTLRH